MKSSMFTLKNIYACYEKVKTGADFPRLVYDLQQLGVAWYQFNIPNGVTTYHSVDGEQLETESRYAPKTINKTLSKEGFVKILKNHQKGETDFPTFVDQTAENAITKWISDLNKLTCTYYDLKDEEVYSEPIPKYSP